MKIRSLSLQHFRNYAEINLNFNHRINVFIGDNAQGKTNLLEAIYMVSLTKSHRLNNAKEIISWNEDRASITANITRKYGDVSLGLEFSTQGKKAKINGIEQKKLSDFIGNLNVVLFSPEDLDLIKGTPSTRRRFLDMEIAQIHPTYLYALNQYYKILNQRNNYLKNNKFNNDGQDHLISVWNEQLVKYAIKIMIKRQKFIFKLQHWAEQIHHGITAGIEKIQIKYNPSVILDASIDETMLFEQFMVKLNHSSEQEKIKGTTVIGPHRDDLTILINNRDAYRYGSQGQQRTAALSLKLAEIELIHEETGDYPVLLLDDVLSELDAYRQNQLIDLFQLKVQTFITATSVEGLQLSSLEDAVVYQVKNGSVVTQPT
jgi:DNA replication and repair protein RecF